MKDKIQKIGKIITFENSYSGHFLLIIVGFLMTLGTFLKLMGLYNISSDWFWFIGGLGLTVEGVLTLRKQKKFDKKYKIIERCEELKPQSNI